MRRPSTDASLVAPDSPLLDLLNAFELGAFMHPIDLNPTHHTRLHLAHSILELEFTGADYAVSARSDRAVVEALDDAARYRRRCGQ